MHQKRNPSWANHQPGIYGLTLAEMKVRSDVGSATATGASFQLYPIKKRLAILPGAMVSSFVRGVTKLKGEFQHLKISSRQAEC
jgi:hypothetical protein